MGFADYANGVVKNNRKLQNRLNRSFIKTKESTVSGGYGFADQELKKLQPMIDRANGTRQTKINKEIIIYGLIFILGGITLYLLNLFV